MPLRFWLLLALVAASIATCVVALVRGWVGIDTLQRLLEGSRGAEGMALYVVAGVLFQLLWLPRMWGLIASGLLFGPLLGILLSAIADLTSATLSYAFSRYAGRRYIAALLARRPRARALVELLAERRGFWTLVVIRALPVHYTASSYASGLAGVPWWPYLAGTAVGIVPGTLVFNFVGVAARDPSSPWFFVSAAVMLAVVILGLVLARRFWRSYRALQNDPAPPA